MTKWIVLTDTLGGFLPCWSTETPDGRQAPDLYDSRQAALEEIEDLIAEQQADVTDGSRDPDEVDDYSGFQVVPYNPHVHFAAWLRATGVDPARAVSPEKLDAET